MKIPRTAMPQLPQEKLPDFIRYMHKNGVQISKKDVSTNALRSIQKEANREKIDDLKQHPDRITKSPLVVSSEGFILDGNHRWLAAKELHIPKINCIILNAPIEKTFTLAHTFPGSFTKDIQELSIYGKWAYALAESKDLKKKQYIVHKLRQKFEAMEPSTDDIYWNGEEEPHMKFGDTDNQFGMAI